MYLYSKTSLQHCMVENIQRISHSLQSLITIFYTRVGENGLTIKTVVYGIFHLSLMVISATVQVLNNSLKKKFSKRKH